MRSIKKLKDSKKLVNLSFIIYYISFENKKKSTMFLKEHHVHVMIGCADARDFSQVHLDAIQHTIDKYREEKKIFCEFHTIRAAGSFLTSDVIGDIKRVIENTLRESTYGLKDIHFFVHILSHGHLTKDSKGGPADHIYDLSIVKDSPLNCGMLHATEVAIEIEKMILEEKPELILNGKLEVIDTEEELRLLLKEYYAYDGYLAGDWISSIDNLRAHPRKQRTILNKVIETDPELRRLNIQITAAINDYSIHNYIRTDGGQPHVPFWFDVQTYLHQHSANERTKEEILIKQSEKQKPLAGLFCCTDPMMTSRTMAADYYLALKNMESQEDYLPNTIFNFSGSSFDIPGTPFGPYVITGFFYAVTALGLTDWMVMGYNSDDTKRMMKKLENDIIMNLIIKKFKINLIPINQEELVQQV